MPNSQPLITTLTSLLLLFLLSISQPVFSRTDIPVLCYHQVQPTSTGRYSLSVKKFTEQMEFLKKGGYESLNSQELLDIMTSGEPFPPRKVVITFDDGFKSVYDYALPIMQKFGFKGIAFVYPTFKGSAAMTNDQLKELIKAGWSVESHSMTHTNLFTHYNSPEESDFLIKEIIASKNTIENAIENKVLLIAWPYGVYTPQTVELAQKAGYKGAITVDGGGNYQGISPFYIKRQIIYSSDDLNKFILRFAMRGIELKNQHPFPGEVLSKLDSFSCQLTGIDDYSTENYVTNIKVTSRKTQFIADEETLNITGTIEEPLPAGNYFIDFYLRDKRSGITAQNGWLFSISEN